MRIISAKKIRDTVAQLCIQANLYLRDDVLRALKVACGKETNKRAKRILDAIIVNARAARKEKLAICQDTGMPVVFAELGRDVKISGDLTASVNRGVEAGYKKAYLRKSVIQNPLWRGGAGYTPAITHISIVKGDKLRLTVLPKGFGCENKSALKMFRPTQGAEDIKRFIIETVKNAGPDACPPYIVGVGIGGTSDYAALLAKKALLRKITPGYELRAKSCASRLEYDLLKKINSLNIGPMGLGGKATALAVQIETYPTHIAGLPVAVNISCHALRSATTAL